MNGGGVRAAADGKARMDLTTAGSLSHERCAGRRCQCFQLTEPVQGVFAVGAAHVEAGLETGADGGAGGVGEEAAAEGGVELDARHASGFAVRHAGDRAADGRGDAAGTAAGSAGWTGRGGGGQNSDRLASIWLGKGLGSPRSSTVLFNHAGPDTWSHAST